MSLINDLCLDQFKIKEILKSRQKLLVSFLRLWLFRKLRINIKFINVFMKEFKRWNSLKEKIDGKERIVFFRKKEIWWCALGLNVGFEQDGKNNNFERPVLILKKFNKDVLWTVPLTSKNRTGKYYFQVKYNNRTFSVILSQIRLISSKRLLRKIRTFSDIEFEKVRESIKKLI